MPWFFELLGLPWESKAMGPHAFDCRGLVVHALRERFGIFIDPHLNVAADDARAIHRTLGDEARSGQWMQIDHPIEGDIVLMARGRIVHHIGIFTDNGVLHSAEGRDVCHESISHLQRSGFTHLEYWRYNRNT